MELAGGQHEEHVVDVGGQGRHQPLCPLNAGPQRQGFVRGVAGMAERPALLGHIRQLRGFLDDDDVHGPCSEFVARRPADAAAAADDGVAAEVADFAIQASSPQDLSDLAFPHELDAGDVDEKAKTG